ncbi:hypothetical protein Ae201684P_018743 [Aphanomyces euteiches]|uniref:Uncharacterized protein n=1 Tax=Aphanomyces euteiches TaxID=100861 RepID=A0A6G0XVJ2_9STRA|nr:hypothetical protein Ae201684_000954 [Aphanomyces euteiches]KAH9099732.1 hypothetical protein Ae201684P_018743 [Aphanomyces euteiches]
MSSRYHASSNPKSELSIDEDIKLTVNGTFPSSNRPPPILLPLSPCGPRHYPPATHETYRVQARVHHAYMSALCRKSYLNYSKPLMEDKAMRQNVDSQRNLRQFVPPSCLQRILESSHYQSVMAPILKDQKAPNIWSCIDGIEDLLNDESTTTDEVESSRPWQATKNAPISFAQAVVLGKQSSPSTPWKSNLATNLQGPDEKVPPLLESPTHASQNAVNDNQDVTKKSKRRRGRGKRGSRSKSNATMNAEGRDDVSRVEGAKDVKCSRGLNGPQRMAIVPETIHKSAEEEDSKQDDTQMLKAKKRRRRRGKRHQSHPEPNELLIQQRKEALKPQHLSTLSNAA